MVLRPIAEALNAAARPDTRAEITLAGEQGLSVFSFPRAWAGLLASTKGISYRRAGAGILGEGLRGWGRGLGLGGGGQAHPASGRPKPQSPAMLDWNAPPYVPMNAGARTRRATRRASLSTGTRCARARTRCALPRPAQQGAVPGR